MRAAVFLLLAVGVVAAADRKPPKFAFESAESGFKVGLPAKPRTQTRQLATVAGNLTVHVMRYDGVSDVVLSVTRTDYPTEFAAVEPAKLFAGMLNEMKGADGKVVEEKEIALGTEKYPGRQVRIEVNRKVIRARLFLVGTRLYQVMATGSRDGVASAPAEDLFDTFEVVK